MLPTASSRVLCCTDTHTDTITNKTRVDKTNKTTVGPEPTYYAAIRLLGWVTIREQINNLGL